MAEKKQFRVVRQHEGDRFYREGEIREGTEAELGHLVPRVLQPIGAKAEQPPANKMEKPPSNKAKAAAVTPKTDTGKPGA